MEIQIQIEPVAAVDSGSPTHRMFLFFHRYKYMYKYKYIYTNTNMITNGNTNTDRASGRRRLWFSHSPNVPLLSHTNM